MISYKVISDSIEYYKSIGYTYIEAPWIVDERVVRHTLPEGKRLHKVFSGALVGSVEQSFLSMGSLPDGDYVFCTPCFRDDDEDEWHNEYFMKVELIVNRTKTLNRIPCIDAMAFFRQYTKKGLCFSKEEQGVDINLHGVEIGSYGTRDFDGKTYHYGTGVAEPRFSKALHLKSFHKTPIKKAEVGTIAKIQEELDEVKDAEEQGFKHSIVGIELADLIGAVESFAQTRHLTIEELIEISRLTKKVYY